MISLDIPIGSGNYTEEPLPSIEAYYDFCDDQKINTLLDVEITNPLSTEEESQDDEYQISSLMSYNQYTESIII